MRGNSVSIKGNLTCDGEIRTTSSGNHIAQWRIAYNKQRKNNRGDYESVPCYFDCKCWLTDRQLAYIEPLLEKGAQCAIIDGHLDYESWENNSGQKRSKVVIMVDDPIGGMMIKPNGNNASSVPTAPNYAPPAPPASAPAVPEDASYASPYDEMPMSVYDEDIPF